MLKNTFIHVPGLGIKTEQRIWNSGVYCWNDLLSGGFSSFLSDEERYRKELHRGFHNSIEYLSNYNATASYLSSRP